MNTSLRWRPRLDTYLSKDFIFGISYSKMCKCHHTTVLEYEGKKHVTPGEAWTDETLGATKDWYTQWCRCRPLETRDTGLPLLTFNIRLFSFFFFITVEDVLFKKYCLRSTVIPQAKRKKKTFIYKPVRMYTSLSTFCIFKNLKYWRLQVGHLQVHHSFMLRYFTEVLLFNVTTQLYLLFGHCFPVMFSIPTRVMNSKYSLPN